MNELDTLRLRLSEAQDRNERLERELERYRPAGAVIGSASVPTPVLVHQIADRALAEGDGDRAAWTALVQTACAVQSDLAGLFTPPVEGGRLLSLKELIGFDAPGGVAESLPISAEIVITSDPRPVRILPLRPDSEEETDWLRCGGITDLCVQAYLAVPVISRSGTVVGRMIFARRAAEPFTEHDELLARGVADRLATVLENASLLRRAQDAIRVRDEFLNIASHELKTPLTVLKGYSILFARRLRRGDLAAEDAAQAADELARASERLDALVNDLLDTSRIRVGRLHLQPAMVDGCNLVRAVVARFKDEAAHEFVLDLSEPVVGLWDEARLDQVLTNLVSNAVRYSPGGGSVHVSARQIEGYAEFCVLDEGIGVPPERIDELFQPFSRLHADPRIVHGTGLGLYLSQQIVQRHEGTLTVVSELNRGSAFTVRLPVNPSGEAGADGSSAPTS
ncbi:MAG: GAF domain-containing sensor histidine kinase [Dehalococcoidia bacterium]